MLQGKGRRGIMKKLVSTLNMDKKIWLDYRKKGIGGSDAGAVAGVCPYKSAMQVYLDKISGETADFDNEKMREGRDLENYVALRFTEATGKKVRRANYMYYDESNPYMLADVDRLVVGEKAGLECKVITSSYSAKQWEDGHIPPYYYMQCLHYISVMGFDAWYICALIMGQGIIWHKIERDEEEIENLIQIEKEFWYEHVLKQVIPEPDGLELSDKALARHYQNTKGISVSLTGFDDMLRQHQQLADEIESLETRKRKIEQEVKIFLGESEAETGESLNYRVSWKTFTTSRLDEKRLKADHPELYNDYKREIVSKRFSIKEAA